MAAGLGAGTGPLVGGALADFFSVRVFRIDFSWSSPNGLFELPAVTLTGFDFLFAIAFILGLLSLNLLAALREEGEIGRESALNELMAGSAPMVRAMSSVPGVGAVSAASYGYLRRVPGADVALGVTAYQLASYTQAAVASAGRGRNLAREVQTRVGNVLEETVDRVEDVGEHGLELARHATRGAAHAGAEAGEQAERVARAAAVGTLRALGGLPVSLWEAVRGAGYGTVQGALEAGHDPAQMAVAAMEAAREIAPELGITEEEAAAAAAMGVLDAAAVAGDETLAAVRAALPDELAEAGE